MRSIILAGLLLSTQLFALTTAPDRDVYLNKLAENLKAAGTAVVCGYTDYENHTRNPNNKIGTINDNIKELQKNYQRQFKVSGAELEAGANPQMCVIIQLQ